MPSHNQDHFSTKGLNHFMSLVFFLQSFSSLLGFFFYEVNSRFYIHRRVVSIDRYITDYEMVSGKGSLQVSSLSIINIFCKATVHMLILTCFAVEEELNVCLI